MANKSKALFRIKANKPIMTECGFMLGFYKDEYVRAYSKKQAMLAFCRRLGVNFYEIAEISLFDAIEQVG